MSDQQEKKGPSHRVSFAAIRGRDEHGKNVLGPAREIGAIWPREGKDGGGILRFDHTPQEKGVYFVRALDALRSGRDDAKAKDIGKDRER
jgi:hypothetical protein